MISTRVLQWLVHDVIFNMATFGFLYPAQSILHRWILGYVSFVGFLGGAVGWFVGLIVWGLVMHITVYFLVPK